MHQGLGEIFHKMFITDKIELSSFLTPTKKQESHVSRHGPLADASQVGLQTPHHAPSRRIA
jgi:hypothetical protein